MSVEMITALGTGLSTVLGAVAVLLANRSRRATEDGRFYRRQARALQRKFLVALSHINTLEEALVNARRSVPARPEILEIDDDDDDDGSPPQRAGVHAAP